MALLDTLQQILANATNPNPQHVDQISREAPKDQLGAGVADALRSDQTPELGDTFQPVRQCVAARPRRHPEHAD